MIQLVLFDIDGTLIRTGGAGVKAFERAFASEFHIHNGTSHMRFAGRTDSSLVRECLAHHGLPVADDLCQQFYASYVFWLDHLLGRCQGGACAGVRQFLNDLAQLPQPPMIGLLTGNIRLGAEIKLRHYGLWDPFVTGGFGDDHEDRNRIAAVARDRGSRLLRRPLFGDEILVVGDTPHDIRCAQAIEARMLAVATGGAELAELQAHRPTWAVGDLTGVRAADVCGQ